ncbi:MAG: DEAD/DEAH box helicase [Alphaproteobacteria bacterium]|nr:DEAD/DEAH box helicase [Alphaproteobacteria bacterium]
MKYTLRPYQKKFIQEVHSQFCAGSRAVLGQGPTGMGKTVIFSCISDGAVRISNRVLILVHRQELICQTSVALSRFGLNHNIVAPGNVVKNAANLQYRELGRHFYDSSALCTVGSVQTIGRKIDQFKGFYDFIITDECHHAVAGQWRQITDANPQARLLGLTATPERLDGKGLGVEAGGVYETMVLGPSVKELIRDGYLSAPRVYAPPVGFDDTGLKSVAGDYDVKEMALRLDKPKIIGNAVKHYAKLADGMPAIAFCATVEHAQHTAEEFRRAGYNFKCIDGTMDDCDRRDAIEGLGNGKYQGLTSCEIISEGTDIPVVGCAIFLRKTKSLAKYLQQAGRVLRPYPGKEYSVILDHVGNVEIHGFPDDDREWSLLGRSKKRTNVKDDLFVRTCPNCYAVYKSSLKACPVCGCEECIKSKQEVEYIEAELVERQRIIEREERKKSNAFTDLIELGKRRGYKNPYAWASHIFNARKRRK